MMIPPRPTFYFFFLKDPAPTEIYTLSLHDALPISAASPLRATIAPRKSGTPTPAAASPRRSSTRDLWNGSNSVRTAGSSPLPPSITPHGFGMLRSEEHTSELQSQSNLVCRLLLEKK